MNPNYYFDVLVDVKITLTSKYTLMFSNERYFSFNLTFINLFGHPVVPLCELQVDTHLISFQSPPNQNSSCFIKSHNTPRNLTAIQKLLPKLIKRRSMAAAQQAKQKKVLFALAPRVFTGSKTINLGCNWLESKC